MVQVFYSKKPSKISIPERCHPLAAFIFSEMKRQKVTYAEMEFCAGVMRSTFKAWRCDNRPGLDTIEAAAGVLGWSILPVPKPQALPKELRADLEQIAAKYECQLPCVEFIAAAVGRLPATRVPFLAGFRRGGRPKEDPGHQLSGSADASSADLEAAE
jgi:hypothetical protein